MAKSLVLALLALLVTTILITAVLALLVEDPDGWGTFAADVAKSTAIQLGAALGLLVMLLGILEVLNEDSGQGPPKIAVGSAFALAPVLALSFLLLVFDRPLDLYDTVQTLVLMVIFLSFSGRYQGNLWGRWASHGSGAEAGPPDHDHQHERPATQEPVTARWQEGSNLETLTPQAAAVYGQPITQQPRTQQPRQRGSGSPRQQLIILVSGDSAMADRLIDYERKHTPWDGEDELARSAIVRLERDRR